MNLSLNRCLDLEQIGRSSGFSCVQTDVDAVSPASHAVVDFADSNGAVGALHLEALEEPFGGEVAIPWPDEADTSEFEWSDEEPPTLRYGDGLALPSKVHESRRKPRPLQGVEVGAWTPGSTR